MTSLNEMTELFDKVDARSAFTGRIGEIIDWIESLPGVEAAGLICTDRLHLGADDHSIHRIAAANAGLLPAEPAILNGKSPIPSGIFRGGGLSPVTVFSPFLDRSGGVAGAILVKSSGPKQFLRHNRSVLGLLSSKTRDLVEIASLRTGAGAHSAEDRSDDLTPRVIGKLMDLLNLPMYVMSPDGTFISVNQRFLDGFHYANLDDLNSRAGIFIRENDWNFQLQRLTSNDGFTPLTVKVHTGDDRVRTVQDYSMLMGKSVFGVLLDVSDYVSVNEKLKETLETQQGLNERLSTTTALLQKTQATAMKSLAKLAEYRDKETGGHLQRICEYMRLVTREIHDDQPYSFHVSKHYPEDIYISGMLHDIGKVGVPDQILLKPGPLDESEWTVMKKHTNWGYTILNQADHELGEQSFLTLASRIALHHHEWWNGKGYPHGLAGDEIPLSARIGAVADVYDALTSRRPYKDAWTHDHAVGEIKRLTGKQFDPVISDIFSRLETRFETVRNRFPDEPALVN
ncbi:MAG: HD domain-containing protein [Spirochaetales bacterium]|nr:HD domain-containing protein [Spirochaetales bacterium]